MHETDRGPYESETRGYRSSERAGVSRHFALARLMYREDFIDVIDRDYGLCKFARR